LDFIKSQGGQLPNAQGLSLAGEQGKQYFPKFWVIGFDEKTALWQDSDGYHGVPVLYQSLVGAWDFGLGDFGGGWAAGNCVLFFRD